MPPGAFTELLDLPLLLVIIFFIFFLGLVVHLQRESNREGLPLEDPSPLAGKGRGQNTGLFGMPSPKKFLRMNGEIVYKPGPAPERTDLALRPAYPFIGAPLMPTGDPLADGVGPASWNIKPDVPLLDEHGDPVLQPMRRTTAYRLEDTEDAIFGWSVRAADGIVVGTIHDLWINATEYFLRYVEVDTDVGRRMASYPFISLDRKNRVAILTTLDSDQFLRIPPLANEDVITALEEEKINAWFAGGTLYSRHGSKGVLL